MKVEIPQLKRCCCCIPLRYGLLAWGYFKLVISLLFCAMATFALVRYIQLSMIGSYSYTEQLVITPILILVLVVDICLTIVFLIGGHKKSAKLLHVFYIYNMVGLGIFAMFFIWTTADQLFFLTHYLNLSHSGLVFISIIKARLLVGVSYIGIEIYFIILIKSEINKLRNCSKYRFTNPIGNGPTVENGTNEQGISDPKEDSYGNGTDSQFEGIISQNKKAERENFNYNKF